tara:strand:+ start:248 stop:895 length:648 start_codon:yes stop_codon:yes gene_type:complete
MKYYSLIPIIGHGSTDLIDLPFKTCLIHFSSFLLFNKFNIFNNIQKKSILTLFSIFHFSHDIPDTIHEKNISSYKHIFMSFFHILMIKKPIFAKIYLNIIHTPLHYFKTIKINSIFFNRNYKLNNLLKINLSLITTLFCIFMLQNKNEEYLQLFENNYGELWWISPIIAHIILNEIININIENKIKLIKYNNYKNYIKYPIILTKNYKNYLHFLM